jgi:hypothetical protein
MATAHSLLITSAGTGAEYLSRTAGEQLTTGRRHPASWPRMAGRSSAPTTADTAGTVHVLGVGAARCGRQGTCGRRRRGGGSRRRVHADQSDAAAVGASELADRPVAQLSQHDVRPSVCASSPPWARRDPAGWFVETAPSEHMPNMISLGHRTGRPAPSHPPADRSEGRRPAAARRRSPRSPPCVGTSRSRRPG